MDTDVDVQYTWAGNGTIVEPWRCNYNYDDSVRFWSRQPSRGRVLHLQPIDEQIGGF